MNQLHTKKRTCMTLLLCATLSLAHIHGAEPEKNTSNSAQSADGTLEGLVTFRGEIPKSSIADDAGLQRDLVQVNQATRGLAGVVVWLTSDDPPRTKRKSETTLTPVLMDQRDHEFVPRVLAVLAGQPVKFMNSDPANHNVRTSSPLPTNEFNVFTGIDGSYTHRFVADRQQRPIRLGCDIHPWMRGWIYVFERPEFAVSDEHGRFRIASVLPGRYKLVFRQPDIRYAEEREIIALPGEVTRIEAEVRVPKDWAREQ
jgi:plastocyanin